MEGWRSGVVKYRGPGFFSLCRLPGRVLKRANVIRLAGSASKPAVAQKPLRKHFSGLRPLTFPFSEPGPSPRPRLTFSDDQSFHPPSKKNSGDFFHSGAAPPTSPAGSGGATRPRFLHAWNQKAGVEDRTEAGTRGRGDSAEVLGDCWQPKRKPERRRVQALALPSTLA